MKPGDANVELRLRAELSILVYGTGNINVSVNIFHYITRIKECSAPCGSGVVVVGGGSRTPSEPC